MCMLASWCKKIGPEGNNYAYGIDSHNQNARIQDGIMLTIYAMEYFGDSLANPIKMTVEWQIRRLGNVRPPASSEHQKRHGGNNISSENVIISGDIKPRIIWVKLLLWELFRKFTALWSWTLSSFSSSISGPCSLPSSHHSSILPRPILALYDVSVMMEPKCMWT